MQDLFAIAQDQPFRFPSTFTFVLRAFSTLEGAFVRAFIDLKVSFFTFHQFLTDIVRVPHVGIGYTLDPNFSFVKIAAPYAQVPYQNNIFFNQICLLI